MDIAKQFREGFIEGYMTPGVSREQAELAYALSTSTLLPERIRNAAADIVARPTIIAGLGWFDVEMDETLPVGVIKVRGETTTVVYDVT